MAPSSAAAGPSGGSAPAQAEWEREWATVVAAAKQEGRVTVLGPPGTSYRDALVEPFQRQFPEVRVDYTGAEGSQAVQRVAAERQAGKYLVDLHVGGPSSPLRTLVPIHALDPVEPALILPEVTDRANWLQGMLRFMDNDDKYILAFQGGAAGVAVTYNTRQVNPRELSAWTDLLDPRWRGKIVSADPVVVGSARGNLTTLAASPQLGLEFIRKLYAPEQNVRLISDQRTMIDWVAQGAYLLAIGGGREGEVAGKTGLPVDITYLERAVQDLSVAFGTVMILNQAPHPNAMRVYLNWLLSRDGQLAWQKAVEAPSLRMDLPREGLNPADVPNPGLEYISTQHEKYMTLRTETQKLVEELAANRAN
jgi:iron(III) transport system substrate-binding protein